MASSIYSWFQSEVLFWRCQAGIIWSALLMPLIIMMFSMLTAFSLIHPIQWLYACLSVTITSAFWFTTFIMVLCMSAVAWFSLSHFSVSADVSATSLNAFLALFRWSRLPLLTVSYVAGAISAWSLSRIMYSDYRSLTLIAARDQIEYQVLNEKNFFLILVGLIGGLYAHWQFFHSHQYYLQFLHVKRRKLFHIRSEALGLFLSCLWRSFQVVKYYYIFYWLFGALLKSWISKSFKIAINTEIIQLNSLLGIFNLNLFWQTYWCTFVIMFSWSMTRAIIRIYLTDHMEFVICPVFDQDKDHTLPAALTCSTSQLLQHLGFLDFSHLTKFSPSRRQELLTLSQPGGHPRTWLAVSSSALSVINELIERIREENWSIMSKVTSKNQSSTDHSFGTSKEFSQGTLDDLKLSNIVSKLLASLSSLPITSGLLSEYPDVKSRSIFATCQLQIWALEGLSQIAAKAIEEDKYGVVQSGLPTMICTLLDLYEVTEKHFKLSSSVMRKCNGSNGGFPDALLRFKLHFTTKTALYRLVNTYKQYLEDLRLHPDYSKKLQPFVDFLV